MIDYYQSHFNYMFRRVEIEIANDRIKQGENPNNFLISISGLGFDIDNTEEFSKITYGDMLSRQRFIYNNPKGLDQFRARQILENLNVETGNRLANAYCG